MYIHCVLKDFAVLLFTHSYPTKYLNHKTDTYPIFVLELEKLEIRAEFWFKSTVHLSKSLKVKYLPLKLSYRMPRANEARREIVCELLVHSKERLEDSRLGASYFSSLRLYPYPPGRNGNNFT